MKIFLNNDDVQCSHFQFDFDFDAIHCICCSSWYRRRRLSCQIYYSFWDKTTFPFDFIFWLKWKFQWNWKTMRSKEGKKFEWEKLFLLSPKPHVFSGNQKFVFQLLPQRFTSWRMESTMQFEPLSLKGNVPIIKKPFNESFS